MSLFIKQDETRSRYQQQIAQELQEKARQKAAQSELPDGVEDSAFIRQTEKTNSHIGVWIALAIVAACVLIYAVLRSTGVIGR